ncbi:penicillin-binding protein activator LpoB [Candidatus Profftia sp. (ex Adelges kitamiensis)]|uniref:penicillin-binding protein activator LpoB n=1 Tax=Candidatus Profftia sp. (ex Adelges kitamiensis) TaxID=2864218 RepID=UPI001CE26C91|nr:penicillin-binding protein activator LpoB [Candidatus Profftia sp. (ex Adelges kitamiensis)]
MKKCLFVAFVIFNTLLLIGCQIVTKRDSKILIKRKLREQDQLNVNKINIQKEQFLVNKSLILQKNHNVKWSSCLKPLINQIIYLPDINTGSLLLVNSIQNKNHEILQVSNANKILQEELIRYSKFTLVSNKNITNAKQYLGLSTEDNLVSRHKAIDLARIVQAQYMLYSLIEGDTKSPKITIQLMLVQTGEILWHGSNLIVC